MLETRAEHWPGGAWEILRGVKQFCWMSLWWTHSTMYLSKSTVAHNPKGKLCLHIYWGLGVGIKINTEYKSKSYWILNVLNNGTKGHKSWTTTLLIDSVPIGMQVHSFNTAMRGSQYCRVDGEARLLAVDKRTHRLADWSRLEMDIWWLVGVGIKACNHISQILDRQINFMCVPTSFA